MIQHDDPQVIVHELPAHDGSHSMLIRKVKLMRNAATKQAQIAASRAQLNAIKKPIRTVRIATVKATGSRYMVSHMSLPVNGPNKVYCFGNITEVHRRANGGASVIYEPIRCFMRDSVEIEKVVFTFAVASKIWEEHCEESAAADGCKISYETRGKNRSRRTQVAVHVPMTADGLLALAAEAEAEGKTELAQKYFSAAEQKS